MKNIFGNKKHRRQISDGKLNINYFSKSDSNDFFKEEMNHKITSLMKEMETVKTKINNFE